jgi:DnaK suppressor protein
MCRDYKISYAAYRNRSNQRLFSFNKTLAARERLRYLSRPFHQIKTSMAQKSKKIAKAKPAAKKAASVKKPVAKAKPQAKAKPATQKPAPSKKSSALVKKASSAKKPAPAKKTAAVSQKPSPKKAAPVSKKATPVKKAPPAKKTAPKKVVAPAKKAAPVKKAAPLKKAAPVKKEAPIKAKKMPVVIIKRPPPPAKVTGWESKQRDRLLQLKDTLLDSMSGVGRDSLRNRAEGGEASAFGMHTADAGSDAYDRDFALSLLSQERDSLFEIDAALKKINDGNYGFCEISGKAIPHNRLEALPFARYTVECQAELEKTNRLTRVRQPVTSLFGLGEEGETESEEEDTTTETKD